MPHNEDNFTQIPVTESPNPASEKIDTASALEITRIMNSEDQSVAAAVSQVLEQVAGAVESAASSIQSGGRLIYVGAGTSGRLGVLDASECPPTFSTQPGTVQAIIAGGSGAITSAVEGAEDDADAGRDAIARKGVTGNDTVVGISTIGSAPFVRGALEKASESGAETVLITCNRPDENTVSADIIIAPVVGPEIIAGSTRLKAGTATKMILNMISTGAMIRCGRVYDNLMVDVHPASEKLRKRAALLVKRLTGLEEKECPALLEAAGNRVKTAVIMHRMKIDRQEAEALLEKHGGFLRKVLEISET